MFRRLDIHIQKKLNRPLTLYIKIHVEMIIYFILKYVYEREHKASQMLGKGSPAELHPRLGLTI